MAVKKSELYSGLWECCNNLRGGMDSTQYKDYILTLLFVKYVSDKYGRATSPYAAIKIPPGGGFADMLALRGRDNIGEGMDKIVSRLAEGNHLEGVIDIARFNDDAKFGHGQETVAKLTALLNVFNDRMPDFGQNRAENDDIIGDAYEYLMRKFAIESGKSKGQFYTPAEVSRVLAGIVGIEAAQSGNATLYDPACGSGSLLIRAAEAAAVNVTIYGQEKEIATAGMAKMNFVLHGRTTAMVKVGSVFSNPQYFDRGDQDTLEKFDFVVVNPPFSDKNWTQGLKDFGRFDGWCSRPPEKNGDYAWLLHVVKSLKREGRAAVILPHGVLFRGNAEAAIRQAFIERRLMEGIIGLPANLFYGTGIPACIIVLDKRGADKRAGVFMVDASHDFAKDGNKNRLRERDLYKIISVYKAKEELPGYSRFVPQDEIAGPNAYNLNLPRYVGPAVAAAAQDIGAHLAGGVPSRDLEILAPYWAAFPGLRRKLFAPLRPGYEALVAPQEAVREAIFGDQGFKGYAGQVGQALDAWEKDVDARLRSIDKSTKPKRLITEIAGELLAKFRRLALLDKYDVYEALLSYWNETMSDDVYILVQEGYKAIREPEKFPLVPRGLVIEMFFAREKAALDKLEAVLEALEAELAETLEGAEEGSVILDVLKETGALDKKALTQKLKDISLDAEDRATLKKLAGQVKRAEKAKKDLKQARGELDKKVGQKYKALTDEECQELLVGKKWYRAVRGRVVANYEAISHAIANRVVGLCERYGQTLPQLEGEVKRLEGKVRGHLGKMGFTW